MTEKSTAVQAEQPLEEALLDVMRRELEKIRISAPDSRITNAAMIAAYEELQLLDLSQKDKERVLAEADGLLSAAAESMQKLLRTTPHVQGRFAGFKRA